jgi:hypothetical protein
VLKPANLDEIRIAKPTLDPKRRDQLTRLERSRRLFGGQLKEFEKAGQRYIDRARSLSQDLVETCRVYSDRYKLLEALPPDGIVAEVGTDRGRLAARIMAVARPRMLHIFELDITRISPENIGSQVADGRCRIHAGDYSELLRTMPDHMFDWIYVDGDHSYEGVKRDIAAAAPKLKPGGLMVFNDYAVWSVTSMRRCGVAKAANEFVVANGWSLIGFAFQTSMYCDAAFRKPERQV